MISFTSAQGTGELEPNYDKMVYRYLGKTGLKVSLLGYGNMIYTASPEHIEH